MSDKTLTNMPSTRWGERIKRKADVLSTVKSALPEGVGQMSTETTLQTQELQQSDVVGRVLAIGFMERDPRWLADRRGFGWRGG